MCCRPAMTALWEPSDPPLAELGVLVGEHEFAAAAGGPNDSNHVLSDARVGSVNVNEVFLSTTPALSACAQVGWRLATIVVERRRYTPIDKVKGFPQGTRTNTL